MTTRFWIGASTVGELGSPARGIRPLDVDADGSAVLGEPVDVGPNPMFLARDARGRLAIAHELDAGEISTWRIEGDTLHAVAPRSTTGSAGPCHVAFDADGARIFAANYGGGRLSVHDAETGELLGAFDFEGDGPRFDRQESPHAHQAVVDGARSRLLVSDLGSDRIRVIRFAPTGEPTHEPADDLVLHAGAGPRHLVVVDDLAVVANELDRTASLVDLASGEELQRIPIGSEVMPRGLGASAIRLTRAGTILIGDRDLDGVQALRLDASRRSLSHVASLVTGGTHPRDLELTHDERHLIVADQASDSLAVVALDEQGVPTHVVSTLATPAPTCVARV
ncbi:lactonase family protein [Agromyces aerolatus]|uniref:lactonase family protein n=1 Tax=Agromyces sp. LY-1074 TaxID=3074080 RepID=UPI00286343D9|nr:MULTISPECIES: beta-propeller fold lactonase family protein [unclassified Agromyces]MDR5699734.1 beta-propeller fold lactonase family protein [Agromyces sp. LY-1074]MDR5706030.1 beta-propeller fold lactonase family protein [Agromyces sp. LY-1358]